MIADLAFARPGADDARWLALRLALWPDTSRDEHRAEMAAVLAQGCAAWVAMRGAEAVGFAEASLRRDYVNGTNSSPVVFLEGLYVEPAWRGRGVARALVDEAERWGAGQGCTEFASDVLLENTASQAMHRALGFAETDRVVYFIRPVRRRAR